MILVGVSLSRDRASRVETIEKRMSTEYTVNALLSRTITGIYQMNY